MKIVYTYDTKNQEYYLYRDIPIYDNLIIHGSAKFIINFLLKCINEQHIDIGG